MIRKSARIFMTGLALILLYFVSFSAFADNQAVVLNITGTIGPAAEDYVVRGLDYARDSNAQVVILQLDTPGGLDTSMRGINQAILASTVPVVAFVSPEGARAVSAGTFILYASQLAVMAPGTHVGAASPVQIIDGNTPQEKPQEKKYSTHEKKAIEDAAAYIRSLATLHNRNAVWAEQAVRDSVSITADEALKLKVIDYIANDIPSLLEKINGRTIQLQDLTQVLQTKNIDIENVEPDWRNHFLSILTHPNIAYLLLIIGMYGLFFEFYNPGFALPGILGAICFLLALYSFDLLPVSYTGFGLLLLGLILMGMEVFVASYGVFAIFGFISFILGSVFLFDTTVTAFSISWFLIFIMSLATAGFFFMIIYLAVNAMHRTVVTGREALINSEGEVVEFNNFSGLVRIQGELWKAYSKNHLKRGDKVRVLRVSGLLLTVEPNDGKKA